MHSIILGFNGERLDPVSGITHLGNGYRANNAVLMRFNCPDSMSPFGAGGINHYAYCAGDPVNQADPSGHHSIWGWVGIGVGVILGALMTPISGGSSLAVALSVVSVATAVVSTGLAIAQQFVEEDDPKAGAVLGWAALGTGIVSGLSSAALSRVAPGAKSLVSFVRGTSNRPFGALMLEGSEASRMLREEDVDATQTLIDTQPRLSASGLHPLQDLPLLKLNKSGRSKAMDIFWKTYKSRNRSIIKHYKLEQGMDILMDNMGTKPGTEQTKIFFKKGSRAWLKDNISPNISDHEINKLRFIHAEVLKNAPLDEHELRYLEHIYQHSGIDNPAKFTTPGPEDQDFGPFGDLISF